MYIGPLRYPLGENQNEIVHNADAVSIQNKLDLDSNN